MRTSKTSTILLYCFMQVLVRFGASQNSDIFLRHSESETQSETMTDPIGISFLGDETQKEASNINYCRCISFGSLEQSCFQPIPTNRSCQSKYCPAQKRNYCVQQTLSEIAKYDYFFYAKEGRVPLIAHNHSHNHMTNVFSLAKANLTLQQVRNIARRIDMRRVNFKDRVFEISKLSMKKSALDNYQDVLPFSRVIDLFVDRGILDKIFAFVGVPFNFVVEVKAAHYPTEDWNSCDSNLHFNFIFPNVYLKLQFMYFGQGKTSIRLSGFSVNTNMERSLILLPNRNSGQILSILYFDPGIKNLGFQFHCCNSYKGYFLKVKHILFPHFIRTTNAPPSPPKNLSVSAVRMYYNSSIEFTLEWGCQMDWNGPPKSYEILCKFYDTENSNYSAQSCEECFAAESSQNFRSVFCQQCWNETFTNFHYNGPYLFAEKRWDELKHTFFVQTNLNDFFQNGSLRWEKVKENEDNEHSFAINFDTYNALYNRYNIKGDPNAEYSVLERFFKHSVLFPGPYLNPKQLQPDAVEKTVALCAVRGRKASGLVGKWSQPVKVNFTEYTRTSNLFSTFMLKVYSGREMQSGKLMEINRLMVMGILQHESQLEADLNHQPFMSFRNPVEFSHVSTWAHFYMAHLKHLALTSYSEHGPVSVLWHRKPYKNKLEIPDPNSTNAVEYGKVGCYHWIFNVWYAFVLDRNSGKYHLSMFHGDTGNIPFEEIPWINVLKIDGTPLMVKCPPLHSFIVWTEETEDMVKVWRANLNSETGNVVLPPDEIEPSQLCECGEVKKVSSGAIDLYYKNVHTLHQPVLLTPCKRFICGTQLDKEKGLRTSDSIKMPGHLQHVTSIAADTNGIYAVFEDDKHYLYKYSSTSKHWVKNHYLFMKNRVLKPKDPELYPAYKIFFSDKLHLGPIPKKGYANMTVDHVYQISSQTTVDMFPIPPVQCMFPDIGNVNIEMLSESSNEITIHSTWKRHEECKGLAKPSVVFQVKYSLIANDTITDPDISQFSCTALPCLVKNSDPSKSGTTKLVLSHLINHRYYYFEIGVLPALSAKLQVQWYSGQPYNFLPKVHKTAYEPKSDVVSKIAVGSSIGVILIILFLLGIMVWMYNRTWYMYRTLQRLSVKDVSKSEKLGEGHYGEVWKATVKNKAAVVKILKESATNLVEKEFRDEALILSKLRCENIIKPLGICLQARPIILALEYMNGGSVESYLRKESVRRTIEGSDLFLVIQDALRGCQYLESEGYIHRDLAARNCLVQTISNTNLKAKIVKLSDFGLAKDVGSTVYQCKVPPEEIPVAWTAPEAFAGTFSSKSDIWSFGVLIWEVFSWASPPYGKCYLDSSSHHCPLTSHSNAQIEMMVRIEYKSLADLPDPCISQFPDKLKGLMKWCWALDPDERPSFTQLSKFLLKIREELNTVKWIAHSQTEETNSDSCQENMIGLQTAYSESHLPSANGEVSNRCQDTMAALNTAHFGQCLPSGKVESPSDPCQKNMIELQAAYSGAQLPSESAAASETCKESMVALKTAYSGPSNPPGKMKRNDESVNFVKVV